METWILQANYPVVTVTRDYNEKSVIIATQERFLSNPTAPDPLKDDSDFGLVPLLLFLASHQLNN